MVFSQHFGISVIMQEIHHYVRLLLQDTMEGTTGRWGRVITSACVVVYCFGTTITFLIIIGDQFDRTFSSLYGPDFANKVHGVF